MRLLLIEDDDDGREMLGELFRLHGWEVTTAVTAREGYEALAHGGFDLVISDENLEGESGAEMLRVAATNGLLRNVGVLMYTADPRKLDVPSGVRVLTKPLPTRAILDEAARATHRTNGACANAAKIQLVLYVTDSSSSQRALERLQRVLARVDRSRVDVEIKKVEAPPDAEVVAPVLVKRSPGPETRLAGELSTRDIEAVLRDADGTDRESASDVAPPSVG